MQVAKFTTALLEALEEATVKDQPLGAGFIDTNMIDAFNQAGLRWTGGTTPMTGAARSRTAMSRM